MSKILLPEAVCMTLVGASNMSLGKAVILNTSFSFVLVCVCVRVRVRVYRNKGFHIQYPPFPSKSYSISRHVYIYGYTVYSFEPIV